MISTFYHVLKAYANKVMAALRHLVLFSGGSSDLGNNASRLW